VRPQNLLHATEAGEFEHSLELRPTTLAISLQRFQGDIQADLVADLETVGQHFLRAVDSHGDAVEGMDFDASRKSRFRKAKNAAGG
jgi:hypothetical protein